ncbi:hypothetical protein AWB77_04968 [Caballeronia fortuita]|uniref:Uncharacterized protein n=1 Tax=Caballeronia fortuita TaxID=1777138 RepID=A0A158D6S9_9BURK|nr:hypothetical protein [Caballeronia fortuita]SAK90299.1 hypothetical protein AWB77_04968 [Caballeronia fortuita]
MFDNTSLDQFSLLDELPSFTPVWHPFTQHAERTSPVEQESKETTERSHRA